MPRKRPSDRTSKEAAQVDTRLQRKRRAEEDLTSRLEGIKKAKVDKALAYRAQEQDLQPLPDPVPRPAYDDDLDALEANKKTFQKFFAACVTGNEAHCRDFIEENHPSEAVLAYALEEASHNFQISTVDLLLQHTTLHFRCFRRCPEHPDDLSTAAHYDAGTRALSRSIFSSGRLELLPLLKVFLKHGWHPNQLLGPLQKARLNIVAWSRPVQEVALHWPRCVADTDILKLLLEAGADPTIAREKWTAREDIAQRMSGFVLDEAINAGSPESVDLLLGHGAQIDMCLGLFTLARPYREDGSLCLLSELDYKTLDKYPWDRTLPVDRQCPESPYPTPPVEQRLAMATHLLSLGADVNAYDNIFPIVGRHYWGGTPLYMATPLSHAISYNDWYFVEWLLDNGADPTLLPPRNEPYDSYAYRYDTRVPVLSRDQIYAKWEQFLQGWRLRRSGVLGVRTTEEQQTVDEVGNVQ